MNISPFKLLQSAIRAVPAVRYALGVGGVAAVVMIVAGFTTDYRVAVLGTVVVLVLMFVLLLFANVAAAPHGQLRTPALVLTWFSVALVTTTATLLLTCYFFSYPASLDHLLPDVPPVDFEDAFEFPGSWNASSQGGNSFIYNFFITDFVTAPTIANKRVTLSSLKLMAQVVARGVDPSLAFDWEVSIRTDRRGLLPGQYNLQTWWKKADLVKQIESDSNSLLLHVRSQSIRPDPITTQDLTWVYDFDKLQIIQSMSDSQLDGPPIRSKELSLGKDGLAIQIFAWTGWGSPASFDIKNLRAYVYGKAKRF